MIDALIYILWK